MECRGLGSGVWCSGLGNESCDGLSCGVAKQGVVPLYEKHSSCRTEGLRGSEAEDLKKQGLECLALRVRQSGEAKERVWVEATTGLCFKLPEPGLNPGRAMLPPYGPVATILVWVQRGQMGVWFPVDSIHEGGSRLSLLVTVFQAASCLSAVSTFQHLRIGVAKVEFVF
mmetsp:Transcript_48635/g.75921  ORF Transcript_48635/g.75921 Transcript_48635/m.75921 type:complete len:169 (-) Transcript_48635:2203-2709(-)